MDSWIGGEDYMGLLKACGLCPAAGVLYGGFGAYAYAGLSCLFPVNIEDDRDMLDI